MGWLGKSTPATPRSRSPRPRPLLRSAHYAWLALGLLVVIVHGSLIPYHYRSLPLRDAVKTFGNVAWYDAAPLEPRGDWVVSILTYAGLGFVLMGALCVDRPRVVGIPFAPLVALFCALLGLGLEFLQLYFPPRTVSLNDLVMAGVGSGTGPVAWLAVGPPVTRWGRRLGAAAGLAGLATRLLPGYLIALLVLELMPFDLVFRPHELAVKYGEGKIWLVPFRYPAADDLKAMLGTLVVMACWLPLGLLLTLKTGRWSLANRSWKTVLAVGLGAVLVVEVLKLFVYSRYTDATHLLSGSIAVLLGWRLGGAIRTHLRQTATPQTFPFVASPARRGPWWPWAAWALLGFAWLGTVVALNWRPFNFTTTVAAFATEEDRRPPTGLERMSWIPMAEYYWGSKYQLFDQFVSKFLAFAPLGVLAGLRLRDVYQKWAAVQVLAVALAVAAVIEVGQCYLPGRTAGLTDVLVECLGAWAGLAVTQHVRVVLWGERMLPGWCHESHA